MIFARQGKKYLHVLWDRGGLSILHVSGVFLSGDKNIFFCYYGTLTRSYNQTFRAFILEKPLIFFCHSLTKWTCAVGKPWISFQRFLTWAWKRRFFGLWSTERGTKAFTFEKHFFAGRERQPNNQSCYTMDGKRQIVPHSLFSKVFSSSLDDRGGHTI